MSSYLGNNLRVSIFGQSHSPAIGVTVDGLPVGEEIDMEKLERFLQRRAPGHTATATDRREGDKPRFLCGLVEGRTCGAPLTAIIENTDVRPRDYDRLKDVPRPGHADYTAQVKYGGFQDVRGGGHFSGRLTAPLCIAGGIALQILARRGVRIAAHICSVAGVEDRPFDPMGERADTLKALGQAPIPVLDAAAGERMERAILEARAQGDSLGGVVEVMVTGLPAGVGGPLFGGMESRLAAALFGIPAVKGVEFGAGFGAAQMPGSRNNDPFRVENGRVTAMSNHAGGILGGITTGAPLVFRAAFKPTPSIALEQDSVSLSRQKNETLTVTGRHDPCIVPRAVPVTEAAAALVVLDALLDPPVRLAEKF